MVQLGKFQSCPFLGVRTVMWFQFLKSPYQVEIYMESYGLSGLLSWTWFRRIHLGLRVGCEVQETVVKQDRTSAGNSRS